MITRIHRNTPDRPYTNNHCSNAVYTLPRHPEMPTTWHVKVADIRLSRNSRGSPQGVVRSGVTEELVAMQVEREPLKEPSDVEDAVAPSLEDLHAVVEPLDKSARLAILEVVRDLGHPPVERPKKTLELSQPAYTHPLVPAPHCALAPGLRIVALEQCRQVFPQVVGLLERWRHGEDPLEQLPLLGLE